ncbi:uncharacterized protein A1O5_05411 [Cladophialophora psammophila CBS 110553]|uniref:Nicotinamide-nucleotide adenylyltransferase n=1 Tax=Cladophialophora psammophila CBS 110553 TaxID=1182543 RepID=W9WUG5_9EURO|nr:uncharacterized protein A1O5_05411 [Cladophialophora psammophila CBS 110553]EXJ71603.1 hypothetical protein A1O5_05411 [Cladophialophora psammophila CBS 110553]
MSPPDLDMQALQHLRAQFSQALKDFASSSSSFCILHSIPPPTAIPTPSNPIVTRTLYLLDSSFNPPSKAHTSLVKTALKSRRDSSSVIRDQIPRVLFLLATVNADKKPQPADFEDRLVMMALAAEDLRSNFSSSSALAGSAQSSTGDPDIPVPIIDIGITKEPYFIDKATAIDSSGIYRPPGYKRLSTSSSSGEDGGIVEQIHLTGFDTLLRIFTPKYYPNYHPPLSALESFLRNHRLRATIRVDANSPSQNLKGAQKAQPESSRGAAGSEVPDLTTIAGQEAYLQGIKNGALEKDGLKREWAERVELVVDESGETEGVSSTKIRDAMKKGDWDEVKGLVGHRVGEWIRYRSLYLEEDEQDDAKR